MSSDLSRLSLILAMLSVLALIAAANDVVPLTTAPPVPVFHGKTSKDLHREYNNIFRHGNRNAASHLWSSFLLERAPAMTRETFEHLSASYCAVSGSPVNPHDYNRYLLRLEHADGSGKVPGFMHYCCWPCVCDTQDFIQVDSKTVRLTEGGQVVDRQFWFNVMANPCEHEEKLADDKKEAAREESQDVAEIGRASCRERV